MGRSLAAREITLEDPGARLGWVLVVGTIPAGLLGLSVREAVARAVRLPDRGCGVPDRERRCCCSAFERLRRRPPRPGDYKGDADARIGKLSWRQRGRGRDLAGGGADPRHLALGGDDGRRLMVGLSNEDAARYSFLLATPIIGAAALLKLPELFGHKGDGLRGPALVAALCAALTTFLAVKFLMRWFETNRLTPFGIYCIVVGSISTIALVL